MPASRQLGLKDGLTLLAGARTLVACKGKRVERFDLRHGLPDSDTLARVLLGPTGNLRAPTLRVGKTVIVGYDETTYQEFLAG